MAISTEALSLKEYYSLADNPLRERNAAFCMIQAGSVMEDLKMPVEPTLSINGTRFIGGLQGPDWQPLNSEPSDVKSVPTPYSEQAYQFAVKIDIPIMLLKNEAALGRKPEKLFDRQVQAFYKALAYDFNLKFFKNKHVGTGSSVDPDCFVGIYGRLLDPDNKYQIPSECQINANGLDLSDTQLSGANVNTLIRKMQAVCYALGRPNGDGLIFAANEDLIPRIEAGIRLLGAGGGFDMTKDAFGRQIVTYRNARVISAGRTSPAADGSQGQVITSTENAAGTAETGSTYTSIVAYTTDEDDLHIKQFMQLSATDPYKLENGTHMRVVIQNAYLMDQANNRAFARIYGIKVA